MKVEELSEYFQENLYEMSNFWPVDTGLPDNTRLFVRVEPKELPHSRYRIKIKNLQKGECEFGIIPGRPFKKERGNWEPDGKTYKKIGKMLYLNGDAIRDHIDDRIGSGELTMKLRSNKKLVERA